MNIDTTPTGPAELDALGAFVHATQTAELLALLARTMELGAELGCSVDPALPAELARQSAAKDLPRWLARRRRSPGPTPGTCSPSVRFRPSSPMPSRIKSLRKARGLTQEQLAGYSGLSPNTIRRLEHGSFSPSLDTLAKLAGGMEIQLGTLFVSFELGQCDPS